MKAKPFQSPARGIMLNRLKENLIRMPGARQVKKNLMAGGHTEKEANVGALAVAILLILVGILLFNSFVWASMAAFFQGLWGYFFQNQNQDQAVVLSVLISFLFGGFLLYFLNKGAEKKAETLQAERRERQKRDEMREHLGRGAMGHFEGLFRSEIGAKFPGITVKSVHVVDMIPRIRFQVNRQSSAFGEKVEKNYEIFRNNLFGDVLRVLETAFQLSPNIPFVIVDAMMEFINRKAEYYDGAVLSVKAQREVFENADRGKTPPFKILTSFDLRYHDGMEVEALPEEESKHARVIEKIREKAPRLEIRYEAPKTRTSDGWEKPPEVRDPVVIQETLKGKALNAMPLAEFQALIVGLLSKMSYDIKGVKKIPGGTLQILADYAHPVIGGNFMVLARQYPETAPVHADLVRELDALAREEACKRGVYIVTSHFTEEARNITRKMAVDLVGLEKLNEILAMPAYDGRWTFRVVDEKGVFTDLGRMPLLSFEKETDLFLKSLGFRVSKIRRVPGGAVVAVADHDHPITGGKFAVMARQVPEGERVPAELVSELSHVMASEFCHRGLLMVTADFGPDARALARHSNVELVDRNLWENMRRHI